MRIRSADIKRMHVCNVLDEVLASVRYDRIRTANAISFRRWMLSSDICLDQDKR